MFDKRAQLRQRLRPVTRSLRQLRFWRISAVVLGVAALAGAATTVPASHGRLAGPAASLVILAAVACGLLVAALIARRSFRNERNIALLVEQRYPALRQRLLTAVQLPSRPDDESSYLQQRLIEEADAHGRTHRWAETVSTGQVITSRLAAIVALALLAASLWTLAGTHPTDPAALADVAPVSRATAVLIEPGDTEIERGTTLVVTARYQSLADLGDEIQLVCVDADGSQRRLPMQPTLEDPLLAAFVSSVQRPLRYQVVSTRYRSDVYCVEVFDDPALVRSDAQLQYPDYTGMLPKRIEDTIRVTAVEGSRLTWQFHLNKPVAQATLVDADGQVISLAADDASPLQYQVEFDLDRSRRWQLRLVDRDGRPNKSPPELVARVLQNEPPRLKLLAGGDVEVSPLEEFPVAVSVRDDFGVERFGLTYQLAGREAVQIELGQSIGSGETARGDYLIDFEAFQAEADQLLTYHFWAEDFGPEGAIRRVQGDLHFAAVRPFEEIYREDQSGRAGLPPDGAGGAGEQAEQLAELQKQVINATWKVIRREVGPQPAESLVEDIESIHDGQADALGQLQRLTAQVTDDQSTRFLQQAGASMEASLEALAKAGQGGDTEPLADGLQAQQAAYQALLGLRAREFQVSRSNRQQQPGQSRSGAQQRRQPQLDQLELRHDENRYEMQSRALTDRAVDEADSQRDVIDRLRQLAQRQEDINQQVAQLQSALELAESEEARRGVERQLKRLRDQQQDLLRQTDALDEAIQQAQRDGQPTSQPDAEDRLAGDSNTAEAMQQAGAQLEQTRENIRAAAEALSRQDASQALAAGTRAQRELDEVREELRQQAAGSFDQAMRLIRGAAQDLDQRQQEIAQHMDASPPEQPQTAPGLRPERAEESDVAESLRDQQQRLRDLLDQVERTIGQAESSEPLLAQNLYDTYRHTQQRKVEQQLGDAAELVDRNMPSPARRQRQQADEAINDLRQRLEDAAGSVLGNQTRALERALGELEQLQQQLDDEIAAATGRGSAEDDDADAAQRSTGDRPREVTQDSDSSQAGADRQDGEQAPADDLGGSDQAAGGLGGRPDPLTGQGFRGWSDRMRDVEQILENPALRGEATRVRERAREARSEFRRHSLEPQWDDVEQMIAKPLRQLTRGVAAELLRRTAERHAIVPIDRDPVPDRYADAVRRYYESLGSGR